MVNGQRAQVSQAAGECHLELSSNATAFPPAGGTGSVEVRASSALCTWTASSDSDWISIGSGASGKGSAPVSFTVAPTTGPPRSGTLTIAGQHFSVTQSEGCTYAIAPTAYAPGASGGSQVVTVTSAGGCPWTTSSNAEWLSVSAPTGVGTGSVTVTATPTSGPARSGTLTIAGQILTVTQSPGCSFDVAPLTQNVEAAGGSRSFNVTTAAGCAWSAASNQPWITITSGANGTGSGTVTVSVAAETGPSRSGTLTIAGQTRTITQGSGCTFAISPDSQSVSPGGGTGAVSVTAPAGCAWTAASGQAWISITSGASGNGNGTVNFTAAANTGAARTGTITAAGQTFTVAQGSGCSAVVTPDTIAQPSDAGSKDVNVTAANDCTWTAVSNAPWIAIGKGATGSGNGTVRLDIQSNTDAARSGTATIAGRLVTVNQATGCSITIAPSSQPIVAAGGNGMVTVTAGVGCTWTAVSGVSWITVDSGASGSGGGTVAYTVQRNMTGTSRTGTITIGGQQFRVNQAGS